MSKLLTMEEIKKIILDFIEDGRKNQAVLLNGEWGCGKTFFVKEKLISQIDTEKYQIFQISLYGISSIEKIQDMIYGEWIEKAVGDKTEKFGPLGGALTRGIGIFGKGAVQFIEGKIGTDGSASEAVKEILEQNIGKNKKPILIFDDIERCQIDIIELMGFLNNLSENNGYKLILVANECEINRDRDEDDISIALKYEIALNNKLETAEFTKKRPGNNPGNRNEDDIKFTRDELREIASYYFERKSTYERTREKLIGLTVPYSVSITESFDEILSKFINDTSIREVVDANKEKIIDLFECAEHRNLRTLIAACIAIEYIISSIDQERIPEEEILKGELTTIILYTVYSAMRRTDGKGEYNWASDTRYGCVNNSVMKIKSSRIYGYAFIDEYWKTQCIDAEVVYIDIKTVIDEKVAIKKSHEEREEYQSLALNRLINWHLLPNDEEVKQHVQQMKEELKQKKYYPQDFKEIIITLMRINNPNFGMNPDENIESNNAIFDSLESRQFVGMSVVDQEAGYHLYAEWEKLDISEFINLMIAYFDDEQFVMTKEMIRVVSEDKQFIYNYRQLTMPLIERIEKIEMDKISSDKEGVMISEMFWDDEFEMFCRNSKTEFINQGRFLSLFNYDKLIERFIVASPIEIHHFCSAVKRVYSFSNLSEGYFADYETVKRLSDYISENIDGLLNEAKTRVKEIALRRLKSDMNRYEHSLRRTNITE